MKTYAKLIHKSSLTYLPTNLPVYFFGMPDGKVYLIYARFYQINYDNSSLEYVIATHKDFSYDYENERLFLGDITENNNHIYSELVDKPDPCFMILNVYRNINSYSEAASYLNNLAYKILYENKSKKNKENSLASS